MWLFHVEKTNFTNTISNRVAKRKYGEINVPCGEINVSEKTMAKSSVAKLSVAKSTYTMDVPIYSQLLFTTVYLYHYKSRIKCLLEKTFMNTNLQL